MVLAGDGNDQNVVVGGCTPEDATWFLVEAVIVKCLWGPSKQSTLPTSFGSPTAALPSTRPSSERTGLQAPTTKASIAGRRVSDLGLLTMALSSRGRPSTSSASRSAMNTSRLPDRRSRARRGSSNTTGQVRLGGQRRVRLGWCRVRLVSRCQAATVGRLAFVRSGRSGERVSRSASRVRIGTSVNQPAAATMPPSARPAMTSPG